MQACSVIREAVFKCFGVDAAEPACPGEPSGPASEVR